MGILSKKEITIAVEEGRLQFEPGLDQFQLSPIGVDLRVGNNFFIPKLSQLNERGRTQFFVDHLDNQTKNEIFDQIRLEEGQYFELLPGEFIMISSFEKISIKSGGIMAMLFPRSSTSRRGISLEPGVVDPFFEGYLTIPIVNRTKTEMIRVYPGERIAQLTFQWVESSLTQDEALSHGLSDPKYQGSKAYALDFKFDPKDEIELISKGKLDELKEKYKVEVTIPEKKGKKNETPKLSI